jgi:hypothetical protein
LFGVFAHAASSQVAPGKYAFAIGTSKLETFAGAGKRLGFVFFDAGTSINEHEPKASARLAVLGATRNVVQIGSLCKVTGCFASKSSFKKVFAS